MVVGGTYRETTTYPSTRNLWGSGLRAAAALAEFGQIRLKTAASHAEQEELALIGGSFGIDIRASTRLLPVSFEYFSPIGAPVVQGVQQPRVTINARGETVLLFGMVEANANVSATTLVFDPQGAADLDLVQRLRDRSKRFAVVLNSKEASIISGETDPACAGRSILHRSDANAVIVKCGACGALVIRRKSKSLRVAAHRTRRVWPIGSGDAFSAAFAWHWGNRRTSVTSAARLASASAAYWCGTGHLPLPRDRNRLLKTVGPPLTSRSKSHIYLAGPFYNLGDRWLTELARSGVRDIGMEVFSPLHDVGVGGDAVARKDLEGMEGCGSVLALLTNNDPGTLFEIGHARAKQIPVVGYTTDPSDESLKMLRGTEVDLCDDLATAVYRAVWASMS